MSTRFLIASLALLCAACATSPHEYPELAQPLAAPIVPVQGKRPVVALVLGAGGSRGFAHIGVIKVLEAAGIEPAIVVGSSSGAIVAALYAGGYRAAALEAMALEVTSLDLIDFTLFGPARVEGEALQNFLNRALANRSIESLDRAFAVVATERADRRMTVFTRGNAGLAVRASSSIPDLFWPVIIAGVEYVDGGLSSRVPVAVARRMGADVVIAVDVSWRGAEEAQSADVAIRPATPRTRPLDLSARIESIAAGAAAAEAALPAIHERLALADAKRRTAATSTATASIPLTRGHLHRRVHG
jgi:NTE family protein